MIVKICGITRGDDASLAVALGATALGFVFWSSSPRRVTPAVARYIVAGLPSSVLPVGVFVDATREEIEQVAADVGLAAVQLHGSESPEFARQLTRRVIKAVALDPDGTDDELARWQDVTLLIDAHDPGRRGGTGRVVDWGRAAAIALRHEAILAGGLTPLNVAEAIATVRPAGIDVSSGVEASPGVKDPEKLRALFDALASVEA